MSSLEKLNYTSSNYRSHFDFWKRQLSQFSEGFVFKQQKDNKVTDGLLFKTIIFSLNDESLNSMFRLAGKNDTAIFNCLLGAFVVLINKYSEQDSVLIDSPGFDPLMKASNSKVPLPFNVLKESTFRAHLNYIQDTIRNCYKFQDYPLDLLNESAHPVDYKTNVLISYDKIHGLLLDATSYDLWLNISRKEDAISFDLFYNTSAFEDTFINKIPAHFAEIFKYLNQLDTPLKALNYLTALEKNQLLVSFNNTDSFYKKDKTVQEIFEIQVAKTPDAIAVVNGAVSLTYKQVNQCANRLANHLKNQYGLKQGDIAGIMLEKSEYLLLGLLAILKSGAAYLPIDANYPEERKKYILNDAKVKVLLTDSFQLFNLSSYEGPLFALDVQLAELNEDNWNLQIKNTSGDLAYVIYTSGSSGKPKGVMVKHYSLLNLCQWHKTAFNVTPSSKATVYASIGFDAFVWEIWPYLLTGASLYIIPDNMKLNLEKISDLINDSGITHTFFPTAICEQLNHLKHFKNNDDLLILTGGDELHKLSGSKLNIVNNYGPTESTVVATSISLRECASKTKIPIGKPVANTKIYILDNALNLVPVGIEGEIFIAGDSLAEGYLNNQEMTEAKFIPNPFEGSSLRMYRTGDLGRWLEDGNIEFLGRKDEQVKIRGNRTELGEIKSTLLQHNGVEDAFVYTIENQNHEKSIASVIVPDIETSYTVRQILKLKSDQPKLAEKLYELPNGMLIHHKNKSETEFIYKEIFEDFVYLKNDISIQEGDVIVDVGANIGLFSLFVGTHFNDVQVYAFEPMDPIYEVLSNNLSLYKGKITAFNYGLSNEDRFEVFSYYPYLTAISGRYGSEKMEKETVRKYLVNQSNVDDLNLTTHELDVILEERLVREELQARLRRLSDVIKENNIQKIDLLKIDVEKSELDVLYGIDDSDWSKIKQVVIEAHDIDNHAHIINELLKSKGFNVIMEQEGILDNTNIFNIYAIKPGPEVNSSLPEKVKFNQGNYWVNPEYLIKDLKQLCKIELPDFMVPSFMSVVDAIPLTPNQKVDKKALPTFKDSDNKVSIKQPQNDIEQMLVNAWESVLQKKIGIDQNFFEVGGDSIKAIQISSRIQNLGYRVEVRDIFHYSCIEELALWVKPMLKNVDQTPVQGIVPLTPIQKDFFLKDKKDPHHFNQSVMLYSADGFDEKGIQMVFQKLQEHHDMLRVNYSFEEVSVIQKSNGLNYPLSFNVIDLTEEEHPVQVLEQSASKLQSDIDLANGPLMNITLFKLNDGDRLLIIVHHLIIDTVSWRILFEDIEKLYQQYQNGEQLELPAKTDAFKTWSENLINYSNSEDFLQEKNFWKEMEENTILPLVKDYLPKENLLTYIDSVSFTLDESLTSLLLTEVNKPYNTEINDILLTALSLSFKAIFYHDKMLLAMEGHGREEILDNVDITRTVGWFSSVFPVVIDVAYGNDLSRQIKEVKRSLRLIPNKGIGYGILKYLTSDNYKENISFSLKPEISLNYLGQFDSDIQNTSYEIADETCGNQMSPDQERDYLLDIKGMVVNKKLSMTIEYSPEHFHPDTIEKFWGAYEAFLKDIIGHCSALKEKELTSSDYFYKELSEEDLNSLFD